MPAGFDRPLWDLLRGAGCYRVGDGRHWFPVTSARCSRAATEAARAAVGEVLDFGVPMALPVIISAAMALLRGDG
ncbi:MAG: hypothetical protein ACREFZ_04635 [Acetobacteraceae bacterium]